MEERKKTRCPWRGIEDPEYARYHDEEWGVPQENSQFLFEKLILEGFQAGLSWLIILKKREAFREAFGGFNPEVMASYEKKDIQRLMDNKKIIRNKLKIESAVKNARAYISLSEKINFSIFLWSQIKEGPIINKHIHISDIPTATPHSHQLSKTLKKEGFRFVGPRTIYAFMQSVGMVNDHVLSCPRHKVCSGLQQDFKSALQRHK